MAWGLQIGPKVSIGEARRFERGLVLRCDPLSPGPASGARFASDPLRGRHWLRDEQQPGEYAGILRVRPAITGLTWAADARSDVIAGAIYTRAPLTGLTWASDALAAIDASDVVGRVPVAGLTIASDALADINASGAAGRVPVAGLTLASDALADINAGTP